MKSFFSGWGPQKCSWGYQNRARICQRKSASPVKHTKCFLYKTEQNISKSCIDFCSLFSYRLTNDRLEKEKAELIYLMGSSRNQTKLKGDDLAAGNI